MEEAAIGRAVEAGVQRALGGDARSRLKRAADMMGEAYQIIEETSDAEAAAAFGVDEAEAKAAMNHALSRLQDIAMEKGSMGDAFSELFEA